MNPQKLDRIIKQFWKNERHNDKYHLGVCSEVAVSLKKFLKAGVIVKSGLMHTAYKYGNYYCDIRGCFTEREFKTVAPGIYLRPATKKEIAHINKLLEHHTVAYILNGLKQAQKEVR